MEEPVFLFQLHLRHEFNFSKLQSGLIKYYWFAIHQKDQTLAFRIRQQLDRLESLEGTTSTLALLDKGLNDEQLRFTALELTARINQPFSLEFLNKNNTSNFLETFPYVMRWLSHEYFGIRSIASVLVDQIENFDLQVQFSLQLILLRAVEDYLKTIQSISATTWHSLSQNEVFVNRLLQLCELKEPTQEFDNFLCYLLTGLPRHLYLTIAYVPEGDRIDDRKKIIKLLEKASFSSHLIPLFQKAVEYSNILEVMECLLKESISVFNSTLEDISQKDINQKQSYPYWLIQTLENYHLTPKSSLSNLIPLLFSDIPIERASSAICLLKTNLSDFYISHLMEATQSNNDWIRQRASNGLRKFCESVSTNGDNLIVLELNERLQKIFRLSRNNSY